jgi:hypothetical protein
MKKGDPIMEDFPAFPVMDMEAPTSPGMTLRDYFAAKAMSAIVCGSVNQGGADKPEDAAPLAAAAYFMADAMLKERAK